jgi:hypothetical protein
MANRPRIRYAATKCGHYASCGAIRLAPYVFTSERGSPFTPEAYFESEVSRQLKKLYDRIGSGNAGFVVLRIN